MLQSYTTDVPSHGLIQRFLIYARGKLSLNMTRNIQFDFRPNFVYSLVI